MRRPGAAWLATAALLTFGLLAQAVAAPRPPAPAGAKQLSPGQLPRTCTTAEHDAGASTSGSTYGYYFSKAANAWISAPFCYPLWGNLEASAPQIVGAGAKATVTTIPNQGSNSAQYAPETKSILWTFPGRRVSGCGNADLTCTVILTQRAIAEWQWGEFHVTMPRTFFVDSPGSNCAGQHLCAGFATNAWSFVGVPPSGTSAPLPPDRARLCIGSCGRTSVISPKTVGAGATAMDLTAGCGGAGASASSAHAAQAGAFCPVKAKTTTDKKALTEAEKIQEADEKARAERFQIMKDLQTKIFDVTRDVTENKSKTADKAFNNFDHYIHSNAGSPDVVAMLQDADAGLSAMFPPQATADARAARARTAQVGGPAASAILHSMSTSRPSPGDAKAYRDAFTLASSPTASPDRGAARLLLSIAGIIGRRVLVHDLGSAKTLTIASASARVPARGQRRLALKATALGGRALRILALSPKGAVKLTVSSRGRSASRSIAVG
jgi:hypothetical protein